MQELVIECNPTSPLRLLADSATVNLAKNLAGDAKNIRVAKGDPLRDQKRRRDIPARTRLEIVLISPTSRAQASKGSSSTKKSDPCARGGGQSDRVAVRQSMMSSSSLSRNPHAMRFCQIRLNGWASRYPYKALPHLH